MKTIKLFITWLVVICLLCFTSSYIVTKYYEEDLKVFAVTKLNQQLATEIDVKEVELSVFKKFPYTSLEFKDVLAKDALITIGEKDTLFFFNYAYLQFNLIDVLRNNFILQEIDLEHGFIRAKINAEGYDNYHIIKKDTSKSRDFLISLNKVTLNDVEVEFNDMPKKNQIIFTATESYLKGAFSSQEYEMDVYGEFEVEKCNLTGQDWVVNRHILLDLGLYVRPNAKEYKIRRGHLFVDKELKFNAKGSITVAEFNYFDLQFDGEELDIIKSATLLPKKYKEFLASYHSRGILSFSTTIKGAYKKKELPRIQSSYQIEDGMIVDSKTGTELKEIYLKGIFDNQGVIELSDVRAKINESRIEGAIRLKGFSSSVVDAKIVADANLADIKNFFRLDTLSLLEGRITCNINHKGRIADLNHIAASDFRKGKTSGEIGLSEVSIGIKGEEGTYDEIKSILELNGNTVRIKSMKGVMEGSDFEIEGVINNLIPFLITDNGSMSVKAVVNMNELNLDEWIVHKESKKSGHGFELPDGVELDLKVGIEQFKFQTVKAQNVRGTFLYSGKKVKVSPLQFSTMDGGFKGDVLFYGVGSKYFRLVTIGEIKGVNIKKMFTDLENFGQETLKAQNISGSIDATFNFRTDFDHSLKIVPKKIYGNVDLTVEDGRLTNFSPLFDISDYIKNNKLLSVFIKADELHNRLKDVKFTSLRNQILVKDETIQIPKMEINTSAINIKGEGTHTFSNELDYKVSFYLSELLTKNKDRADKKGRTEVFLDIGGTLDEPDISYDHTSATKKVKQVSKAEQKEIKQVMKEEFGLFKKDSTINASTEGPKEEDFDVEWEEEIHESVEKQESNKDKKRGWSKKKKKEELEEFDFEEDDF